MTYHTVFEFTQKAFHWEIYVVFFVAIVIGVLVIWVAKRSKSRRWKYGVIAVAFMLTLFLKSSISAYLQYRHLHHAYAKGDYSLIEGNVQDFKPMPFEGHQDECFSVKTKKFCYSD